MSGQHWHGTYSGYTTHRCRCVACTVANRQYHRRRRAERRATRPIPSSVEHGTRGAYTNWSCRCNACTEAHRVYQRLLRATRPA